MKSATKTSITTLEPILVSETEAGRLAGVAPQTLKKRRQEGRPLIPYREQYYGEDKRGYRRCRVFYEPVEIRRWAESLPRIVGV
jgi:hypothetical protein